MDFLQKPLAWSSKFYLGVQSKNCGRNNILIFFSEIFRILSEKFFRLSAKKLQEVFKTTFYVSRRNVCGLKFFLQFWNVLVFLQNPLAWFSNFYLRVQSKNSGRNNFLILLFGVFFGFWEKHFSDFRRKNFKKLSNLPSARPEEQFVAWNFFLKFWTVLDFLQNSLAWFSNFYLRVQIKYSERKFFFILLFIFFSDFDRKIYQTFGQKTSRSFQNYPLRVQRNSLWLEFVF